MHAQYVPNGFEISCGCLHIRFDRGARATQLGEHRHLTIYRIIICHNSTFFLPPPASKHSNPFSQYYLKIFVCLRVSEWVECGKCWHTCVDTREVYRFQSPHIVLICDSLYAQNTCKGHPGHLAAFASHHLRLLWRFQSLERCVAALEPQRPYVCQIQLGCFSSSQFRNVRAINAWAFPRADRSPAWRVCIWGQ
jgi:hypothetical protein